MATQPRSGASWERVLAAIEADAARAASLLTTDDVLVSAGIAYDGQDEPAAPSDLDVPVTWRLPSTEPVTAIPSSPGSARGSFAAPAAVPHQAAAPADMSGVGDLVLPDPDEMPPVTAEVRDRLQELRNRITMLQSELTAAIAEAEAILARPTPRRAVAAIQAELVDRRL